MSKFLFQNGQTVLFIGDSITDCGRRAQFAPFGDNGYVKLAIDLITARYPERKIHFINKGIGGHTVVDLQARWHDDVVRYRPDWLSIKIGINDLHRTLFNPNDTIPPKRFEEVYRWLLEETRKKTRARLILVDPFYISLDHAKDSIRGKVMAELPKYIRVVDKLVREFKTLHVRSHEAYRKQLGYRHADQFCTEPVHPNTSGHMVLAHEWLRSVGW